MGRVRARRATVLSGMACVLCFAASPASASGPVTATTGPPTSVTGTSAVATGTIDASANTDGGLWYFNFCDDQTWIQGGGQGAYCWAESSGGGFQPNTIKSVSDQLTGLTPGTLYHYRLFAGPWSSPSAYGSWQTFTSSGSGKADAPLVWLSNPSGRVIAGSDQFTPLMIFKDTDPSPNLADLSVAIDWGDGSRTAGVVKAFPFLGNQIFIAGATHSYTYSQPTRIPIQVLVRDAGGSSLSASFTYVDIPIAWRIIKAQQKQAALQQATQDYESMDVMCKVLALHLIPHPGVQIGVTILEQLLKKLGFEDCVSSVVDYVSNLQKAQDPPSNDYSTVVLPRHISVSLGGVSCSTGACSRLRGLTKAFLIARALETSLNEAISITQDRYTGALLAHNASAANKQKAAFARYMKQLAKATKRRRIAGHALASEFRRDGVKFALSGGRLTRAITDVLSLRALPKQAIERILHDGLATDAGEIQNQLAQLLASHPPPNKVSLAGVLSG